MHEDKEGEEHTLSAHTAGAGKPEEKEGKE
jgi:hypothetical protein